VTVDGADSGDQPVSRCLSDEFVDRPPAPLGGDDEWSVLHKTARVTEIRHVLSSSALARLSSARHGGLAPVVEPKGVAFLDLGQVRSHFIEVSDLGPILLY
jgi:hypothetical protein